MAQFNAYRTSDGAVLLDCQSDLLDHLNTRFVVPLIREDPGPAPVKWLNPCFNCDGEALTMYTQFAASVPAHYLGESIASLAGERDRIVRALDTLWIGI